ncbi:CLRN3 protein, partial [Leptocoma aspasia]|nr:CLRN3 protein [Leptocoma aspasia]
MPSRKKTSMFASAFCTCVSSFVVICVVLATARWVSSQVRFSRTGSNVTVSLTYGLFSGTCEQFVDAGLQVSKTTFQVADALSSGSSRSLNVATIVVLVLALLSSLLSSGFTCTNAVSNPYQTFLGPLGVYTWNSVCGEWRHIPEIPTQSCKENHLEVHSALWKERPHKIRPSLIFIFLNIASLIIIYFYDHARYSKKKEQERPIENAPKDVILF